MYEGTCTNTLKNDYIWDKSSVDFNSTFIPSYIENPIAIADDKNNPKDERKEISLKEEMVEEESSNQEIWKPIIKSSKKQYFRLDGKHTILLFVTPS